MRILVADPYWGDRGLIQDILELGGHEIFLAGDAEGTLAAKQNHSPDVVLLDLAIARPDNYQFAARLKGDPRWRNVILIALVPYVHWSECERLESYGFDGYIPKPVSVLTLGNLIAQIVSSKAATGKRQRA